MQGACVLCIVHVHVQCAMCIVHCACACAGAHTWELVLLLGLRERQPSLAASALGADVPRHLLGLHGGGERGLGKFPYKSLNKGINIADIYRVYKVTF